MVDRQKKKAKRLKEKARTTYSADRHNDKARPTLRQKTKRKKTDRQKKVKADRQKDKVWQ